MKVYCPDCSGSCVWDAPPNGGKAWRCKLCGWRGNYDQKLTAPNWKKGHIRERHLTEVRYGYERQWEVQGSAKTPYIVSLRTNGIYECSCLAWTRTTPREDCKHILLIKLAYVMPGAVGSLATEHATKINVMGETVSIQSPTSRKTEGRRFR